jgi:ribosomal protein S12 methylthiotransferase
MVCKELILIAQDLTYYGLDIYKKRNLGELLEALVGGIEWIRLHYAFLLVSMDVLEIMKREPKFVITSIFRCSIFQILS